MTMDTKNHPQIYLEGCKNRVKKMQMSRFINTELKSGSDSDSETESKFDTELMTKLKSGSGSDFDWIILLSIFECHSYFK